MTGRAPTVEIGEDAEVTALLRHVQDAILAHPVAAQAAFAALAAEGRAFAQTEEGAAWARRLTGSRLVEKARAIWEVTSLNVLEDDETTVVPSRIVDAFVKLTHERALEKILAQFKERQTPRGGDASAR